MGTKNTSLDINTNDLEIDESIVRLKELARRLNVEQLVYPTPQSIEICFEVLSIKSKR